MAEGQKECSFAKVLRETCVPSHCKGDIVKLASCSRETALGLEWEVILSRSGLFSEKPTRYEICEYHRTLLGDRFQTHFKKSCAWPTHVGKKGASSANFRKLTLEQSQLIKDGHGIFLPFGASLCPLCVKKVIDLAEEARNRAPEPMDSEDFSLTPSAPPTELGSQSPYCLPSSLSITGSALSQGGLDKRVALNNLLEASGEGQRCDYVLSTPYEDLRRSRKHTVDNTVVAGISAVLHAVTNIPEDEGNIWRKIKNSALVERHLLAPTYQDGLLEDVIDAWNHANSWAERRQILSLVAGRHSFRFLAKFNPKKPGTDDMFDESIDLDVSSDDEGDEDLMDNASIASPNVLFSPPLNYRFYRKAKIHNYNHGHALAPVVRSKKVARRLKRGMIEVIFDYVNSPEVTQNVAYGTYRMRTPGGQLSYIAKVIRQRKNAALVKQLKAVLLEHAFDPPSDRTLFRLLRLMPARSSQAMKGIDETQEAARLGLENLTRIVNKIIDKQDLPPGILPEDIVGLKRAVESFTDYLRNTYVHNLGDHEEVACHCTRLAVSDPDNPEFRDLCGSDHADEGCQHCSLLPDIIESFEGLLDYYKNVWPPEEYNEALHDVRQGHEVILKQKTHAIRTFVQQSSWQSKFDDCNPKVAMATADWGKILSK